ncbi:MAG: hypothetical protein AB1486_18230 [Planctomycetota bacterium]
MIVCRLIACALMPLFPGLGCTSPRVAAILNARGRGNQEQEPV